MLQVNNITFSYSKKPVIENISFKLEAGHHLSIIGESGSGKSTLLKLIYGEFDLIEGSIFWKDTEILGPKHNLVVDYEFIKQVTQEFDLMPFTSVEENIGTYLSNFYPEEKKIRIAELLQVVELENFAKTKVKNLSGGQKQRVALARALAKQPEIILLDEPFSHIDNFKKQTLRRSLFKYLKQKNIACILATHDKEDVLGYADRMILLQDAKISADGTPKKLFKSPENNQVASFFGEFNVFSAEEIGGENNKIVYAHQLKIAERSKLSVSIIHSYFKGSHYLIEADFNGRKIFFEHPEPMASDSKVFLKITD